MRAVILTAVVLSLPAFAAEDALKPVGLGNVKLTGWIGAKADNLIRERVTSDWAMDVMMKECEQAFVDKDDYIGQWTDVRSNWETALVGLLTWCNVVWYNSAP